MGAKKPGVGLWYARVMHAFPFSAISEGNFCRACLRSSKSGWSHWSDRKDLKGQGTPCGQCRHRVRARMSQEYHVHLNVDGLRVLPADFLSPCLHHFVHPWSVRWQPIRFERMATVLITDCVHTPGDCTCASPRWCESIHSGVALAASTPSHLLLRTRRHHGRGSGYIIARASFPITSLGNDNVTATADDQVFARRCRGNLYFEFFNHEVHFSLLLIIPQT